jgi:hypothetical protein
MTPEDALLSLTAKYDDGNDEGAKLASEALRRLEWRRRRGGKVCSRCADAKPLEAFGPDARKGDGLDDRCRQCASDQRRLSRHAGALLSQRKK